MTAWLAKTFAAASLAALSSWTSASTIALDLFKLEGIPGTGGQAYVMGPCYCDQIEIFSPVIPLPPGTYDFGEVRSYWTLARTTPGGGPDQPFVYLLFKPWERAGIYPQDFPPLPTEVSLSAFWRCARDDAECNASFTGAFVDTELVFTLEPGQQAIQIGFIGPYSYTSPLPEPVPGAMLVLGLALVAAGLGPGARARSRAPRRDVPA
jgi:hypothetical protein